MTERLLSTTEAAQRLGVSIQRVHELIRLGKLIAFRQSGRWKIPEEAVLRRLSLRKEVRTVRTMAEYPVYDLQGEPLPMRFSPEGAVLLCSTYERGKSTRWTELYRTANGRYINLHRSLWEGESDFARILDEKEVARLLAGSPSYQLTEEGQAELRSFIERGLVEIA